MGQILWKGFLKMHGNLPSIQDFMDWYDSLSDEQQRRVHDALCQQAENLGIEITEMAPVANKLLDFYPDLRPKISVN